MQTVQELYAELHAAHPGQYRWAFDKLDSIYNLIIDGTRLGDTPVTYRVPGAASGEYGKALGEKVALAHVLAGADLISRIANVSTLAPPMPDFRLTLTDGSQVDAEVGRIVSRSSAEVNGGVNALSHGLEYLESDGTTWDAGGRSMRLVLRFLEAPRGPRDTEGAIREILGFLKDVDPSGLDQARWYQAAAQFPILQRIRAQIATEPRLGKESLISLRTHPGLWEISGRQQTIESFKSVMQSKT